MEKLIVIKKIAVLLLVAILTNKGISQYLKQVDWKERGVKIPIPTNCNVSESNTNLFSVKCDNFFLKVEPIKNTEINEDNAINVLVNIAFERKIVEIAHKEIVELKGFQSAYAIGIKNGMKTILQILFDKTTNENYVAEYSFTNEREIDAKIILMGFSK